MNAFEIKAIFQLSNAGNPGNRPIYEYVLYLL